MHDLTFIQNEDGVNIPEKAKYGYLFGPFCESGVIGGNGVKYNEQSLDAACNEYIKTRINTNKAVGELDHQKEHPKDKGYDPRIKLSRAPAIRVVELYKEGPKWIGKGLILDNETGKEVYDLAKPTSGVVLGISMRVNYDTNSDGEAINIYIISFDVVLNSGIESAGHQELVGEDANARFVNHNPKRYFGQAGRAPVIDPAKAYEHLIFSGRRITW